MVERGEKRTQKVFSLTHWKCFQMNIMTVLWRLQCDIASCNKKDCQGELQHVWLTNSAHYPVCSSLSVMRTGVGGEGSVRPPKTSGRGSGEASTNSVPWGKGTTGAAGERDCDKPPSALPLRLGWQRDGRPSAGHGGGLPWLGMTGAGREWGLAGCLQSYKPLLWLDSLTLTQQAGRVMYWRATEQHKKALNWVQIFTKA